MKKNDLLKKETAIIRVLELKEEKALIINCLKMTMPKWIISDALSEYIPCDKGELWERTGFKEEDIDEVESVRRNTMYQRYTIIAGILPFIGDETMRKTVIGRLAEEYQISKQTIRSYLCQYLALQDIRILLPKERNSDRELTSDEKNIRWSLNKFFYTYEKNSLKTAYTLMLKEKYCRNGILTEEYPTFNQYRYFYRKTRKIQNYLISRNGLSNYQRNSRPCTGDGVQEYAPAPGVGMVDATPCDIYLVNESGEVVGRPYLTACVDAYSGLCLGYSLAWEGGLYSVRNMMLSVISDKVSYCSKHGISIEAKDWPSSLLPGEIITDQGDEYIGRTFEHLAELGITVVHLPSYRPELKGVVEKFFDLIQGEYKPHLKGKGVIEPDFQERGAHDYRKDACLTMKEFEIIILRCVLHYNSRHVIENYPFTDEMLEAGIKPYAADIFSYGMGLQGANFINVSEEELILCLLPRTIGKFSRYGLNVNKLRYRHDGYTEQYLSGGDATVAYDPDDASYVWVIEKRGYVRFELIESRFKGKDLTEVQDNRKKKREIIKAEERSRLQADIDLISHIQGISVGKGGNGKSSLKDIRGTRRKEEIASHKELVKEAGLYDRK